MNAFVILDRPAAVKLTVDNYLLLDRAGALAAYGRTELINGTIYVVSPQHSPHYMLKTRLFRRLADAVDALDLRLETWVEGSIDLRPTSCPEPDIFITRGIPQERITEREIVVLAIEIASTTLAFDLGEKATLYAAHGVPEYCVIDLAGAKVHRMWSPGPDGYAERTTSWMMGRLESATVAGLGIDMDDLA